MSEGRIVGGCCGSFPEPEVGKEKKEECCGSGGCGFGPAKEGSVQDASGPDLLQKKETRVEEEYLIITPDSDYLIDIHDPRQKQDTVWKLLNKGSRWSCSCMDCRNLTVTIFGLKRTEISYNYHELYLIRVMKVVPWNVEKWKTETSEGIV